MKINHRPKRTKDHGVQRTSWLCGYGMKRMLLLVAVVVLQSLLVALHATEQRFFNLTADEVRIDSVLPHFATAFRLGENYADSTYEVTIKYPEFIDMSKADYKRYLSISSEKLPEMPVVEQYVAVERKRGILEVSFIPLVERNGKQQILVSFMLEVKPKAVKRSIRKANAARLLEASTSRYADHSVLASGRWAKIRIPADGVYQLTEALAKEAGFSSLSNLKLYGYGGHLQNEVFDGTKLAELDDLKEVPTCTINGKRLFYGHGPVSWSSNTATRRTRNPYSDYGYYFLTESGGEPQSVDSAAFVSSFYPSADDYHSLHEVDNFAWYPGGRNLCENSPITVGNSKIYTLANKAKAASGKLSVCVTAGSASKVSIDVNGKNVGTITVSLGQYDKNGNEAQAVYSLTDLVVVDTVKVTTLSGGPVRLDYVSMAYDKPKAEPKLSTEVFSVPEYVHTITNQDHHADPQAAMVIIIPTSQNFLEQAKRLADYHIEHDDMNVTIVPADELYNEFASGTPDANAYRRYMKMLYDRATTEDEQPKYLLLFGDCVWDNRMLTSTCANLSPNDYLLAYESENSFNHVYCYVADDFFTILDDGEELATGTPPYEKALGKGDIAVGRFPVSNVADAKVMVDKSINYMKNANAGAWQNTLVYIGDDGNQNLHMRDSNDAAELMAQYYPGFQVKKIMLDAYTRETSATGNTYPEVTKILKQYQSDGALIMDYAGHGGEYQLSGEAILRITDFASFTNKNLPLWITASCDIMPFDGMVETIGETAVLNPKGGAVAFYGTTRTVYASENKPLNIAYLKHVLSMTDGKPTTLGEAQRLAKNELITSGSDRTTNKLQYSLLGDPALRLNRPTQQVVIDEINGMDPSTNEITLKAGSKATVKGHVVSNGAKDESFKGVATMTVRDTEELITCKQNDLAESPEPFTYYDRPKTLFNGNDSIRSGAFNFEFAVPHDINYAEGTGLINVFAVNNDHSILAHGVNEGFFLNGYETAANDSIGPSIYCYLNTPSFVNGGNVNTTPYFVANITDKDGINATGTGIGHDLELIIDGEMSKTYNLNSNFSYDFGTYTSGSTYYSIPELEAGAHSLKFRAWDILNNSSTVTLNFNVVRGLEPQILNISCTNNPATTTTTFIVSHSFTNSNVDLVLDIFDMSGRLLWSHSESGVSTGSNYTMDWDLTMDGGSPLQTGVYLYRVRLSSDGGTQSSKAKKLIVIR